MAVKDTKRRIVQIKAVEAQVVEKWGQGRRKNEHRLSMPKLRGKMIRTTNK